MPLNWALKALILEFKDSADAFVLSGLFSEESIK